MDTTPQGAPAIATAATAAAFRGHARWTTWLGGLAALAIVVPSIARPTVDSAWRFPALVTLIVGLVGVPWAMVAGVRVRLVQQLLVAQPWEERSVEFRIDPVHGFDRHVEVLVRDGGAPVFDGITRGRRLDRRAKAVAEGSDGQWWICADQTGTFVLSPIGGEVLVTARKLGDGLIADRVRQRFHPRSVSGP